MDPMLLVFFGGILISLCLGSDVFFFFQGVIFEVLSQNMFWRYIYSSTVFLSNI